MPRTCTICYGHPELNYTHISSHIHKTNIQKLPTFFYKMTDEDVFNYIHNFSKRKVSKRRKD